MTDTASSGEDGRQGDLQVYEFGGLRFEVAFRGRGATLQVFGYVDSQWSEVLRFDDFIERPHYHAPAAARELFDRSLGEPLAWYVAQIRDHLPAWIERAGFASLIPTIDFDEVSRNAHVLEEAMISCVPKGYVRVAGVGLQRDPASSDIS